MKTYLNVGRWPGALIIISLLTVIYLAVNLGIIPLINQFVNTYIVPPILWGLAALIVMMLPKYRTVAKSSLRGSFVQLALMIGFFQVISYVIGGLFSSFGKSPYSFTPVGILSNLFLFGSMLISMEISRAWLINHFGKKHTFITLLFIAILYTGISVPLVQITSLSLELSTVKYLNSTLLPLVAENFLASLFALLAGPLASIVYRGTLQAFLYFCPILPDLPWAFKGLIGTVVPIIGLVVVNTIYSTYSGRGRTKKWDREGFPVGWVITSIVAVVIIWFGVGLFPFQPALVASGSMQPMMYAGDIVIVAKVSPDVIKQDDVIQFRKEEGITVLHRVIEIQEAQGRTIYITKGDANDEPDRDPVISENVVGKVVLTVPKIGWVSIAVKSFFMGES